jgi:hypothetical protein
MKEADLFWQYARDAAYLSSEAMAEYEKRALMGLACTWATAAFTSERMLAAIFIPSPRTPSTTVSLSGTSTRRTPQETRHVS